MMAGRSPSHLVLVSLLFVLFSLVRGDAPARCNAAVTPQYYRPSSNCSLSLGCARSLCSCAGLFFNPDTSACVSGQTSSSSLSCEQLSACVATTIVCYQQASRLAAAETACADFVNPLHTQLLLAAMGSTSALAADCSAVQCALYNATSSKCNVSTGRSACPLPQGYVAETAIVAPSWQTVLRGDTAHAAAVQGSLLQDVATLDERYILSSSVLLVNSTTIAFNVTLPWGVEPDSFATQVSNGSVWATTSAVYRSYGGVGNLAVFIRQVFDANGNVVSPPPTSSAAPTNPGIDSDNVTVVSSPSQPCDTTCVVGLSVGVPLAVLVLIGTIFFALNALCNRSDDQRFLANAQGAVPHAAIEMAPKPSPQRKYRSNDQDAV